MGKTKVVQLCLSFVHLLPVCASLWCSYFSLMKQIMRFGCVREVYEYSSCGLICLI